MLTVGMDLGAKHIKVVLMQDGFVIARVKRLSGFEQEISASEAFQEAISAAGVKHNEIDRICATGVGRKIAPFASDRVTEVWAAARGAIAHFPSARTVIDIGAEEGRAILINEEGRVKDFAVNEKCAAGAGTFTEAMARALEVSLPELGPLSLKSGRAVPMNAQCAVFAESEVVSLLHARTPKADIARAVHDAIASRIVSMARRISITPDVALIGGMAFNVGFLSSLKQTLEMDVLIPEFADFVPAEGAAWIAIEQFERAKAGKYENEVVRV
ncbi:MAG: CoA activase [Calditrichaeota bacterium]|nr:CoA activase [Calditrichota bacterium]